MRLIDADTLKEAIKNDMYVVDYGDEGAIYGMFWSGIENAIDEQPTAEKTGKWIIEIEEEHTEKYDARIPHWFCSCCRTEYDPYFATRVNYCYVCGAEMEVQE